MDVQNYAVEWLDMDYASNRSVVYRVSCASAREAVHQERYGGMAVLFANTGETVYLPSEMRADIENDMLMASMS